MAVPDIEDGIYDSNSYPLWKLLTLQSHIPPKPGIVRVRLMNYQASRETDTGSILGNILLKPPHPGICGNEVLRIKLTGLMAGPQEDQPYLFMALILSPLPDGLDDHTPVAVEVFDPIVFGNSVYADWHYATAATAYNQLQPLQGKTIPGFYGSYTMTIPVQGHPEHKMRKVRVIVRQHIEGTSLHKYLPQPESLSRNQRKRIMRQIVQAEREFDRKGVGIMSTIDPSCVILGDDGKIIVHDLRDFSFGPENEIQLSYHGHYPGSTGSAIEMWTFQNLRRTSFHHFVDWPWEKWVKGGCNIDNLKEGSDSYQLTPTNSLSSASISGKSAETAGEANNEAQTERKQVPSSKLSPPLSSGSSSGLSGNAELAGMTKALVLSRLRTQAGTFVKALTAIVFRK